MDIIITPGTFNPPATPAVVHGFVEFPKTPTQQVRRPAQQYNSRWVSEEDVNPPMVTVPVIYSYCDYTAGDFTAGVSVNQFNAGVANIITAGVRYVPDGTYAKTAQDVVKKTYSAKGPPQIVLVGGTVIDLGTVAAQYGGDFQLPSNGIRVRVGYNMTVTGTGDGATYTLSILGGDWPEASTGTIEAGISYPSSQPSDFSFSRIVILKANLLRNGQFFDVISIGLRFIGNVTFTMVPDKYGADLAIPVVASGHTWADTLYGPTATGITVAAPSLPFVGYTRESNAAQGTIQLP